MKLEQTKNETTKNDDNVHNESTIFGNKEKQKQKTGAASEALGV